MSAVDPVWLVKVARSASDSVERIDQSTRVLSLQYEDDEQKAPKLTLQVDNFDLAYFDDPDPLWKHGHVVEVQWGYPGRMSQPRRMTIQKVTGSTTLSVEALGKGALMNKHAEVRTWRNMSRADVARAIAKEQGFSPDEIHVTDSSGVLAQVTQARMTDAQLLRDMALREGFVYFVDETGFHFHPRDLGQPPVRRFVYYRDPADRSRGDVISFGIDNDIYGAANKPGGVTVQGLDPKTGKPFTVQADNASTPGKATLAPNAQIITGVSKRDGSKTTTTVAAAVGSSTVHPTTETSPAAAKAQAVGSYSNSQLGAFELTLECVGDPDFSAKSVCRVEGIGSVISGNYYAKAVTHKLGAGYLMSVKARRGGPSQAGKSGAVPAKGSTNDTKPAPGAGDGSGGPSDLKTVSRKDGSFGYQDTRGRGGAPPKR